MNVLSQRVLHGVLDLLHGPLVLGFLNLLLLALILLIALVVNVLVDIGHGVSGALLVGVLVCFFMGVLEDLLEKLMDLLVSSAANAVTVGNVVFIQLESVVDLPITLLLGTLPTLLDLADCHALPDGRRELLYEVLDAVLLLLFPRLDDLLARLDGSLAITGEIEVRASLQQCLLGISTVLEDLLHPLLPVSLTTLLALLRLLTVHL
mmetsp:Transcript_1817/g.3578  ORF Transcript_1817/g.3578 Transcript_1817/m.3578 type:complete len:207 (+) Transcript_1817:860-1480(+)